MKKKTILLPVIGMMCYIILSGYSGGPATGGIDGTGARGGASGSTGSCGGGCHGTAAASTTTVTIILDSAGTTVNHYIAGHTYNIVLTGTNTGSTSLPKFGFQLTAAKLSGAGTAGAVNAGVLATTGLPSGTATRNLAGTFAVTEQTSTLPATSGSGGSGTTYRVAIPWTAPSAGTGTVALYGAINAVNFNGTDDAGDKWNIDTTHISEISSGTLTVLQNTTGYGALMLYPNPTRNNITLSASNLTGNTVSIKAYSLTGALVLDKTGSINNGDANTTLDLSLLHGGIYEVVLQDEAGNSLMRSVVKE